MARAARKSSNVLPLTRFRISSPELPGVAFFSLEGWNDGVDLACTAQRALEEYKVDGCEFALRDTLAECGWDRESIELAVTHPHVTQPSGYGWPYADYAEAA
jgi:hypothetical protein